MSEQPVYSVLTYSRQAALIGQMAEAALLEEVYTAPKPGLVDPYSTGAHQDMNLFTFERSIKALKPFFEEMAMMGIHMYKEPEKLFPAVRQIGIRAEAAMYQATNDVNTHKGAIFTLGIFSATAGVCSQRFRRITLKDLMATEQKMVRHILLTELEQLKIRMPASRGERNFMQYGTAGIRGEAAYGYLSLRKYALPVLWKGIASKQEWNRIKLQVLMSLMCNVEDGNVLSRTGKEGLKEVRAMAGDFMEAGGAYTKGALKKLQAMDAMFTKENFSGGGCADLLAACIFVAYLTGLKETGIYLSAGREGVRCRKGNCLREEN